MWHAAQAMALQRVPVSPLRASYARFSGVTRISKPLVGAIYSSHGDEKGLLERVSCEGGC